MKRIKLIHEAVVEITDEAYRRLKNGDEPVTPLTELLRESDLGETRWEDAKPQDRCLDTWDDEYLEFEDEADPTDDDDSPELGDDGFPER